MLIKHSKLVNSRDYLFDLFLDREDFDRPIDLSYFRDYKFSRVFIPEDIDFKNSDWYTLPSCLVGSLFFPDVYIIKKLEL